MTREEKAVIIGELSEKFAATPYFYITDTGGLTVAEVNAFRRLCFQRGLEYRVVKNTLIAKALETTGVDYSAFNGTVLKGLSGVIFSPENPKTPAKLIKDFKKKLVKIKSVSKEHLSKVVCSSEKIN
jgi:large subunit ribosomal protein L10